MIYLTIVILRDIQYIYAGSLDSDASFDGIPHCVMFSKLIKVFMTCFGEYWYMGTVMDSVLRCMGKVRTRKNKTKIQ